MALRFTWIIVAYLFAQLSPLPVAQYIRTLKIEPAIQDTIIINYQVIIFILALVISVLLLRKESPFSSDEDKASGWMTLGWSILGVFMAMIGQVFASNIQATLFGIEEQSQNTVELMEISRIFPIFIILIAIVGPIFEEIIFRRIIFGEIYKRTNFIIAGTISGIIFAVIHMDFTHLLVYFVMSFVFAFIYVRSKRLIVPILAHVLMNTFVVVVQLFFYDTLIEQLEQASMIFLGG